MILKVFKFNASTNTDNSIFVNHDHDIFYVETNDEKAS